MNEVKIPEDYKQTEIGVIPKDWEVVSLGDIGNCVTGLTYSPNDVSEFGTLVLRSSNVQNGQLAYKDNVYVDMSLPERVVVKEGDILICVRNGSRRLIGKCALIDENSEGNAFGAFMSVFRTKLYPFIFYQFQSNLIQNQIQENMGATINQITNKDLKSFKVMLPKNTQEQTAIATALSDIDNLIGSLEKLIAKKEAIKTGTMQQLLTGKTRLPEFATRKDGSAKGFKQTELGRIPEDWEVVRIIDNHIIATGNTPPTNDQRNYKGKFLFVSPADLGNNKLIHNTQKKLSLKGFKLARKFPKGSTLFTCIGSTIGKTGLATCELTSNQQINAVFPNEIDDFEFTYYALTHHSKRIKNKASEQAVPLINKTEFGQFEYMQPNELKEQTAIATILSDMDAEIHALQQRLEKTRDIKQGMMQQLLTGKVRLAH